jgi:uncharacterized membrane protein HdeD (DUF308 family)
MLDGEVPSEMPERPLTSGGRRVRGAVVLVMGCLALVAPFFSGQLALFLVGALLIGCGILEMVETFRSASESALASTYLSGLLSIFAGIFLLSSPHAALGALELFLGASFILDGINKGIAAWKNRGAGAYWKWTLIFSAAYIALGLLLITHWPISGRAVVALTVGMRMLSAGWAMLLGRRQQSAAEPPREGCYPDGRLRLPPHAEFAKLEATLAKEDLERRSIDAYWCWIFVILFFAIHVGRMRVEWNLVGMISPLVAVVGDIATAFLLAFALILPARVAWRKLTRPIERRCWQNTLRRIDAGARPGTGRFYQGWLKRRMRFSRGLAQMPRSPRAALRWGLQIGLPATAILIAVNPMWGFSWFFNSESWAAGVWDRWAAARTDTWREEMIDAVQEHYRSIPAQDLFAVAPEGVAGAADFSFLVLGDTGEGGGAQHSLRDQYLFLGKRPDVKFLVISSDVIYPSGAMFDYEPKFFLPFKGFTKPIYAIPGNHDWYDALEGFAANFLQPEAARACLVARIETDGRLTTTTENRIDRYIKEAARLRQEYSVSTGWQRGPFFEVQTDRFALIVVDTGVLRTVDSKQWAWLKAALQRAEGKCVLAILGHPLYAGGRYQGGEETSGEWDGGDDPEPFAAVHRLLKEHKVEIVMAGDTHYFEHYVEKYGPADDARTYTSIGTPLDWPKQPALADCAYFPRRDVVVSKLDTDTPSWKMPIWIWAKDFRAWPLTAETVAGAFDYSRAPFFQSFVEVRVEGSANRVRLIPHGANGPLVWRDLQTFGAIKPADKTDLDLVEFVVPLRRK